MPDFIKLATVVGMGIFLTFIGLMRAGIVAPGDSAQGEGEDDNETVVTLGDLSDWTVWLALANVLLIGTLEIHGVNGTLLIGIIGTALIYWIATDGWPTGIVQTPYFGDTTSNVFNAYVA